MEHNHIELIKKPSTNTQKRKCIIDQQIGNRLSKKYVIDTAMEYMDNVTGRKIKTTSEVGIDILNTHLATTVILNVVYNDISETPCILDSN